MSATGEDTKNLNKGGETPAAALTEDIPTITPTDVSSCGLKDVVQTPSQGDYLEDPREIESIIEKKLPSDKEKALDVDSELDFELKWDDDTDLNENQGDNDDIDLDRLDKELESELTSVEKDLDSTEKETVSLKEKDTDSLDMEIDSAFASTEKDLDSLNKEMDINFTSIDKDLNSVDKQADSAFTSTEKDLDHEIETNLMSIEKDDSINKESGSAFTFADKYASKLDKENRSNLISIEKDLDSVDKKTDSVSPADNLNKKVEDAAPENGLGIVNKDIQDAITSLEEDNAFDVNAMDVDDVCEKTQPKAAANESEIVRKDSDDALKTEEVFKDKTINADAIAKIYMGIKTSPVESETNSLDEELVYSDAEAPQPKAAPKESEIVSKDSDNALKTEEVLEDKTIYADAIAKINMGIETSPVESETNSLDEQLVYSDADAPNIENKDLMDEIDAEIAAEINKEKIESAETPKASSEIINIQKQSEGKTTAKESSDMDVDFNSTKSSNLAKDLNDTCSSVTDLETSTYDINNEHGLDRPDVMIDIPTQELIESFDDTEDIAEDANNKLDQSQIKIMDKPDIETTTKHDTQKITERQAIEDEINLEKDISDEINDANTAFDKLVTDDMESSVERNKSADDTVQAEIMEVDTHDVSKEIKKPDIIVNSKLNSNVERNRLDQENVSTLEEKVNHADVILEAITELEAVISAPDLSKLANEPKTVESDNLKLKELENTLATLVGESQSSADKLKLKEDTTFYSLIDEAQLSTSSKEDKDDLSDISKLKENTTLTVHVDEAHIIPSAVVDIESSDDTKLKDVEDTSESHAEGAQPSTSKEVGESSNNSKLKETEIHEVQPTTSKDVKEFFHSSQLKEVETDKAQRSTSKEVKESSDSSQLKEVETDEAQQSTSKEVKESSDSSQLKEVETDKAQQSTSKEVKESSDSSQLKEVETDEAQPSTSKEVKEFSDSSQLKEVETEEAQPSTSKEVKEFSDSSQLKEVQTEEAQPSTSKEVKESSDSSQLKDVAHDEQLSTSNHSELSDEDQEATDSLGLLAESSRVMDDDDEQEQEAEPDDDDDEDDFDQDDESNQMAAEQSEDSNAQQSEADVPREAMDVDESNDAQDSNDMADAHDMHDAGDDHEDEKSNDEKEESNDEKVESNDEKDESTDDKDDSNDEGVDLHIQIAAVVSQTVEDVAKLGESVEATEDTEKAGEAFLEDIKEEIIDVPLVVDTVKDKDAVKQTDAGSACAASSKLRDLLLQDKNSSADILEAEKKSPSKTKKLEISKPKSEINIVELEESSSEDVLTDVQVVKRSEPALPKEVTSLIDPAEVEVTPVAADKPKLVRLNTDEVSIKTAPVASLVIPETKAKTTDPKATIDFGLEIYSLDSDDEETEVRSKRKNKLTAVELDKARQANKCINMQCTSDGSVPLVPASMSAAVYYAANQQRGGGLCLYCAKRFEERSEKLIKGVKDLTPFLSMDMCMIREEFVEISDSDSENEPEVGKDDQVFGEKGAKFLEEHLADVFNVAWENFDIEARLLAAQAEINVEVGQLEEECKEIDAMLNECQKETDKLRNDLYTRFADDRKELPAITICDTPTNQWSGLEEGLQVLPPTPEVREQRARPGKRRAAPAPEPAAKRAAIPLGYAPLDHELKEPKSGPSAEVTAPNDDDNADISVVKLSVEAAPAGLPPPGVATRAPLRPNMLVFAMRNTFGAWHKVRIIEVQPKLNGQFTTCRVRFEQPKTMTKLLPARCLAYEHPPDVRLTIGTRVVALFKDHRVNADKKEEGEKKEAYYSGIVAEIPNPVNSFRYLIFFDDGYAQYVQHSVTRLVCECAPRVWDEVHPFSRQFVRDYLRAYPERPMVRLHAGQSIKTEWDGKWWVSKVLQVDASLVLVYFEGKKDNKTEWIYRGSTRLAPLYLELQAAERTRARPLPRAQAARRFNMPYVEYTRSDEPAEKAAPPPAPAPAPAPAPQQTQAQIEQEIRRQRSVAKKSTATAAATAPATAPAPAPAPPAPRDNVTSRVVFYTPKNAIKPHKMVSHTCGPRCKRTDVLALKDLRTYNPLTKPLLSGWERQQVKYRIPAVKAVMYRAPCGRRIRDYRELHQYLQATGSDMGVDLFDFNPATHCLAEFLLNKCLISKKDLSHGKENVPVPCVNYYDSSLPEFCSYNTERTPTAGVPLNLDPEFLCGCDCTDDCADKSKCACWKMTLEGARTIGLDTSEVGYVYKRLPEPLPSGIYECNVRCKCKQTCLNRVAQHPLQLKLQVFKTANRGWGIRALNDVPKGAFLCVYAGNLLTDATANLDGLNEGDEYLAELDYIEVVEQMKEGFEEDIPEDAKKLDEEESESSSMSSSDEERKQDGDDDFRPFMPAGQYTPSEYSKRLRKREKSKKAKEKEERERKEREDKQREKDGEDCITISDDEELREPAHFSVQTGMKGNKFISKYKSVRTLFGKDEACYIMDAKVQGNIGRYLNHSCTPNVFVQNVFVDSHDPRFPWVAFFALSQIRAGTELTWNYNYDVGSVPGKVLYCYCNAPNCRGRLL